MQDNDQRNLILALVLSAAIFFAFQFFSPPPKPPVVPAQTEQQQAQTPGTAPVGAAPAPLRDRW